VCAHFITSDGDVECSEWTQSVRTPPSSPATKPNVPPTPLIVAHDAGDTWIGLRWEAGHTYKRYFLRISEESRGPGKWVMNPRTLLHDDDGTWGYQRVDGLEPGRVYRFSVQGCTTSLLGALEDNCWGWSAPYVAGTVPPRPVDPRSCISGYVWRLVAPDDLVCVAPDVRRQARIDERLAHERRIGPPRFVPEKCPLNNPKARQCYAFDIPCKTGFVWRAATPTDYVCVPPATREQAWADNAQAKARQVSSRR
jgi:hypothetical protein